MTYQDAATQAAEDVTAQVLAALALYVAGTLTAEALAAVVAAFIAAGNSGAAAIGDLALAAAVTIATGRPAAPVGITRPADDPERLTRAARTILDDLKQARVDQLTPQTPEPALSTAQMRYQRLVEGEIRKATATAYAEAVTENKSVTGWTRGLEPKACQLCRWWWRNGRVWPADHPFPRHTGCDCSQIIVTN